MNLNTYGLVLLLGFAGCTRSGSPSKYPMSIDGHDVAEVVVVEVPRTISAPTANTPETLESRFHQKLDLRAGAFVGHIDELNEAVTHTKCEGTAEVTDLRTGVIFFDISGARVRSFYYGVDPAIGAIDGKPCRLSPALYKWVRKRLSE